MLRKTTTRRLKKIVERTLAGLLIGVPVLLVVLLLVGQHRPGWYRPVELDREGRQRAHSDAAALTELVSDNMVLRRPFEVELVDARVNEWLAVLPDFWPEAVDVIPPNLSEFAVRFEDGRVRLGVHVAGGGWRFILGLTLAIEVSESGQKLRVKLLDVHSGSLPIPRKLIEDRINSRLRRNASAAVDDSRESEPLTDVLRSVSAAEDLYRGVEIDNYFVWFNGRRPFRIATITADDGALRLTLEPE